MIHHETVEHERPDGNGQPGAFHRSEEIAISAIGKGHFLHRQTDARKQRQFDVAIDGQRTLIARVDDLLQLVLVGVGIECQQENCDPDQRHQEHHDQPDQYPLQPDFHSRLKNWGKPRCARTQITHNTNLTADGDE